MFLCKLVINEVTKSKLLYFNSLSYIGRKILKRFLSSLEWIPLIWDRIPVQGKLNGTLAPSLNRKRYQFPFAIMFDSVLQKNLGSLSHLPLFHSRITTKTADKASQSISQFIVKRLKGVTYLWPIFSKLQLFVSKFLRRLSKICSNWRIFLNG